MAQLIIPIFGNSLAGGLLSITSNTTDAPIDAAFTGVAGATSGSGTNASFSSYLGYPVLIIQYQGTGVGKMERNVLTGYSAGTISLGRPLENNYTTGAQLLVIKPYGQIDIASTFTLTAKAWDGTTGGILVIACGMLTGAGNLSALGCGYRGGTGGVNTVVGNQGEGETATGGGSSSANGMGGGGGTNLGANGAGGGTNGVADLSTLVYPGGGGGGSNVPTGQPAVNGGNGGGIIIAYVANWQLTGTTSANGQVGGSGYRAGGSGAGGSILIFTQKATLGSGLITALGGAATSSSNGAGTGGGGGHATAGGTGGTTAGGTGGNGRIAIARCAITDAGTTNPTYTDRGYQTYCGVVGRG